MGRLWLMWAAAAIIAPSPVCAQEVRSPRFELGGMFSGIVPVAVDGPAIVLGVGPRLTFNVTPRFGLELLAEVVGPAESSGTTALYQNQLKVVLSKSRDAKRTVSFTVGAAGGASYQRTPETRIVRLDGSTVVYPGYRRFRATAPRNLVVGVVREQVFHRLASSYIGVHGYVGPMTGIAVRAAIGVSFGVGGYR
jgi:hypothetical protein